MSPRIPGMAIDPRTLRNDGSTPIQVRSGWTHWHVVGKPHFHTHYDCPVSIAEVEGTRNSDLSIEWKGLKPCSECELRDRGGPNFRSAIGGLAGNGETEDQDEHGGADDNKFVAGGGIRLTSVRIRNFRCIRDLKLDLGETTVLIGENNSGKTAVLKAIELGLSRPRGPGNRVFDEYDYRLPDAKAAPERSDPIEIEFRFEEREDRRWSLGVAQRLNRSRIVAVGDSGFRRVTLRVTSSFGGEDEPGHALFVFLDADDAVMGGGPAQPGQTNALREVFPVESVAALRSVAAEFSGRGNYWRGFLSVGSLSDADRAAFEQGSEALNQALIDAHEPLSAVREHLERTGEVIDFGDRSAVSVDALPTRAFSALSRAEVSMASRGGAKIPLRRQGEGTQSLAVLLLFDAHLRSRMDKAAKLSEPLTLIEEPEAHLHPGAVRTLRDQMDRLPGQKILSTHSGDFLATVPATSVRRLAHRQGEVRAGRIAPNSLSGKARQFDSHVRRSHGRLLFSRCWLIVEGETEVVLFEGVAEALGVQLERAGVHCVECGPPDPEVLCSAANQLGIQWSAVFDDDQAGRGYRDKVKRHLDGAPLNHRVALPYASPELFLCEHGFGDSYENRMSDQKQQPTSPHGTRAYWREVIAALPRGYSKPEAAAEAVEAMIADPNRVPEELARIVRRAISLAETQ